MSEETEKIVKEECFCKSKGFRKFLVVALGSFVGVFCALSLFCALHRPPAPMMPQPGFYGPQPYMMMHHHHMKGGDFQNCEHKKMMKDMKNRAEKFKKDMENHPKAEK